MSNFPLYNNLVQNVSNDASILTDLEKKETVKAIREMDNMNQEIVYILVYKYFQDFVKNGMEDETRRDEKNLGGSVINRKKEKDSLDSEIIDINFNFNKFDNQLQKILHQFVKMRMSMIKEEVEIRGM